MVVDAGLVLGAISVVAIPVGFGIGVVAMANPSRGELWFAKICFVAAAICAVSSFAWVTHEMALSSQKVLSAGTIGALVAIALVWAIDWVNNKDVANQPKETQPPVAPAAAASPTPNPPIDNKGGIFIQGANSGNPTVNNFGPPPPSLKIVEDRPLKKVPDGRYVRDTFFELVAAFAPPQVIVLANGANILQITVSAEGGYSQQRVGNNFVVLVRPNPGLYGVHLVTSDDVPVQLRLGFE
jgi:hypothetical protein